MAWASRGCFPFDPPTWVATLRIEPPKSVLDVSRVWIGVGFQVELCQEALLVENSGAQPKLGGPSGCLGQSGLPLSGGPSGPLHQVRRHAGSWPMWSGCQAGWRARLGSLQSRDPGGQPPRALPGCLTGRPP